MGSKANPSDLLGSYAGDLPEAEGMLISATLRFIGSYLSGAGPVNYGCA